MSEDSQFVSGDDTASEQAFLPAMIRDLRAVASAESTAIDGLSQALMKNTGVPSQEKIEEFTRQFFNDDAVASVAQTIRVMKPGAVENVLTAVDNWRKMNSGNRQLFPDEMFVALQSNLDSLVQDYPGLELMRKAQRLLRETGNEIGNSSFICDLRPVFDESRKQIEGYVALATLRIPHVRQNDQREVFEIALTEDELLALVEQGENALAKMEVLKETVNVLLQ